MIKRILIGISCLSLLFCVTGCNSSDMDRNYNVNYDNIEVANMKEDVMLFESINKVYQTNLNNAKNNTEKGAVNLKYINDVYQMASNRFNLDIDILSVYSDEYLTYVSMMQVYCTTYMNEADKLIENKNLHNLDHIRKNTETGHMLVMVEETMNTFLQAMK